MTAPLNDPRTDDGIDELVQFDEALRLGQAPAAAAMDPELEETAQFLWRMNAIWPRQPKKIGPYTLIRGLGQGMIGPAYLVEDSARERSHVLKILWPDLSAHASLRRQLLRVGQAVQQLGHANIASIREVREAGSLCLVVLDYCPGLSLAQWRRTHPHPLPWEGATTLIAQLADTLDTAHRGGLVHGNVKPSNLFLTQEPEITPSNLAEATIRVADFGLASAIQQARLPSRAALPWPMPQYLAPERLHHGSKSAEPTDDVYALGVLLYELLTSRSPVSGSTREELLAKARDASPLPPRQRRADIPEGLDAVVMRCLRRDPADRPASAKKLAESLRALLPTAKKESPGWWKQWLGWM